MWTQSSKSRCAARLTPVALATFPPLKNYGKSLRSLTRVCRRTLNDVSRPKELSSLPSLNDKAEIGSADSSPNRQNKRFRKTRIRARLQLKSSRRSAGKGQLRRGTRARRRNNGRLSPQDIDFAETAKEKDWNSLEKLGKSLDFSSETFRKSLEKFGKAWRRVRPGGPRGPTPVSV